MMCHGQTLQDGGVDLRTKSSMLASKAIVPGKPEDSPMIQRILSRACPPDKNISMAGIERMGDRELQTLRDWIAAGAPEVEQVLKPQQVDPEAREHWAFQPPKRGETPRVKAVDRVVNPVDAFLLAKLEAKGLSYSV
ncbi:MAG TPA: hypothetical protein DEQ62_05085, partial [Verrucomicrobiales bacterium]|nr:hypothetical protein [Verrucomicrobiales bacterium]